MEGTQYQTGKPKKISRSVFWRRLVSDDQPQPKPRQNLRELKRKKKYKQSPERFQPCYASKREGHSRIEMVWIFERIY